MNSTPLDGIIVGVQEPTTMGLVNVGDRVVAESTTEETGESFRRTLLEAMRSRSRTGTEQVPLPDAIAFMVSAPLVVDVPASSDILCALTDITLAQQEIADAESRHLVLDSTSEIHCCDVLSEADHENEHGTLMAIDHLEQADLNSSTGATCGSPVSEQVAAAPPSNGTYAGIIPIENSDAGLGIASIPEEDTSSMQESEAQVLERNRRDDGQYTSGYQGQSPTSRAVEEKPETTAAALPIDHRYVDNQQGETIEGTESAFERLQHTLTTDRPERAPSVGERGKAALSGNAGSSPLDASRIGQKEKERSDDLPDTVYADTWKYLVENSRMRLQDRFVMSEVRSVVDEWIHLPSRELFAQRFSMLYSTDPAKLIEQVTRPFVSGMTIGTRDAVIRLEPEYLGTVHVRMTVEQGCVTAKIAVENRQVQELMEAGIPLLRDTLRTCGLSCEQVEVRVDAQLSAYGYGDTPSYSDRSGGNEREESWDRGRHEWDAVAAPQPPLLPRIPSSMGLLSVSVDVLA